jgi:hypothetical protein
MALNIKDNQQLDLIVEDGHTERVIDGFCTGILGFPFSRSICFIITEQNSYKYEVSVKTQFTKNPDSFMPDIDNEEKWYKHNKETDTYEEIHGVHYYLYTDREKENE